MTDITYDDLGLEVEVTVSYSGDGRDTLDMSEIDATVKAKMAEHLPGFERGDSGGGFGSRDIHFNRAYDAENKEASVEAMCKVAREVSAAHEGLTVWIGQDIWATDAEDALADELHDLFTDALPVFHNCFCGGAEYHPETGESA